MNTRASIPETRRPWFRHYFRESATPPLQESTTYSPEAAEIGRLGTGDCGSWASRLFDRGGLFLHVPAPLAPRFNLGPNPSAPAFRGRVVRGERVVSAFHQSIER